LKPSRAGTSRERGSDISARTPAKPKPWMRPKPNAISARSRSGRSLRASRPKWHDEKSAS
jgi:hypothetical protein